VQEIRSAVRARFIRGEELKYISHLDIMKLFERALRRANIPIAYSQGFNPHPVMVFGLPLSVGVTSEAEYADFEFESKIDPLKFMENLNRELPAGISVSAAKEKQTKDNIMASIVQASYHVLVSSLQGLTIHELNELVEKLMGQPEVIVEKEGKRGVKFVNIRPASASSFNSIIIHLSSPGSPLCAKFGTCLVEVAKCRFPLPPFPPFAITTFWSAFVRSAKTSPVSSSLIIVPGGTFITKSSPLLPVRLEGPPFWPFWAL
jgi:radical SAM-linked protein